MKRDGFEKGFSLIELMVAIAILSVGMAAIGTMVLASLQADRYNTNSRQAEAVLLRVAEQFQAGNPAATYPTTGNAVIRGDQFIVSADTDPGAYYCSWTSTPHASGANQLDIVVGWGSDANCNRSTPDQCRRKIRLTSFYKP